MRRRANGNSPLGRRSMPPIASDALVLRTYKLGETSKIGVLLTRERGKVRAVARGARGARPRYQSALEPLSEVQADADVSRLALAVLAAAGAEGSSVAVLSRYVEAWLLRLKGMYPPHDRC